MRWFFPIVSICCTMVGCSSGGVSSSLYQSRMRSVEMGMQKADFVRLFSESTARGAKSYPQGTVEVLEVMQSSYEFMPTGRPSVVRDGFTGVEYSPSWFYFYNGKLVQYGAPNDWPKDPDKILELRLR